MKNQLAKYTALYMTALRQKVALKGDWLGRGGLYIMIMLIFSQLWDVAFQGGYVRGANSTDLLWYMADTEWIVLSVPNLHSDIEYEVRTGEVAYLLGRPVSYVWMHIAKGLGAATALAFFLGSLGLVFTFIFAGGPPRSPLGLLALLPVGALAIFTSTICLTIVGLSTFWLQDAMPVFWVWNKSLFVLGRSRLNSRMTGRGLTVKRCSGQRYML